MLDQQNKSGVPLTNRSSTSSASTQATRPALLNIFARLTLTAATAILSAAVLLLALEVILSLNHIGEQEYLKIDPVLGFMHLENKLVVDRSEGFGIGKMNSDGLADVDRAFTKPPETTRIAVLGDSLTEALQVPINERFTRVLEAKLNASSKTGAKFEVINFGVGGFSTGQEFVQYVRDVERFKPDQLMLIYHQGDETENNPDSSKWSLRPTFTMNAKGETQIRFKEFDAWRKSASAAPLTSFEWGRRNSHVWQCLLQIHSSLKNDKLFQKITNFVSVCNTTVHRIILEIKPELKKHELEESTAEAEAVAKKRSQICEKSKLQVDESQSNENWDSNKQWLLTKNLLRALNTQCKVNHSQLTIAFVPALEKPISERVGFRNKIKELQKMGQLDGFKTVDLTLDFYDAEKHPEQPILLLAHLSKRGHQLVADKLRTAINP